MVWLFGANDPWMQHRFLSNGYFLPPTVPPLSRRTSVGIRGFLKTVDLSELASRPLTVHPIMFQCVLIVRAWLWHQGYVSFNAVLDRVAPEPSLICVWQFPFWLHWRPGLSLFPADRIPGSIRNISECFCLESLRISVFEIDVDPQSWEPKVQVGHMMEFWISIWDLLFREARRWFGDWSNTWN